MISAVPQPSAVARMIRARHTCFCGLLRSATTAARRSRSATLTSTLIPSRIRHRRTDPARMVSSDCVVPLGPVSAPAHTARVLDGSRQRRPQRDNDNAEKGVGHHLRLRDRVGEALIRSLVITASLSWVVGVTGLGTDAYSICRALGMTEDKDQPLALLGLLGLSIIIAAFYRLD
jgi:hypothetical protein